MEKMSDEWISRTLAIAEENCGKYGTVEVLGRVLVLVLNELQAYRKAEKEYEHTVDSTSEKDSVGAIQEREINKFWEMIAKKIAPNPCVGCPAVDGYDCGSWDGTCSKSLRKCYETLTRVSN